MGTPLRLTTAWVSLGPGPMAIAVLRGTAVISDRPREAPGMLVMSAKVGSPPTYIDGGGEYWIRALTTDTVVERPVTSATSRPTRAGGSLGASTVIVLTAAAPLGGQRLVREDGNGLAIYASADDLASVHTLGLTLNAAAPGAPVSIMRIGELDDPSFAFTCGAVFLGRAGAMTQVAPVVGVRLPVGYAVSATRLLVHLRPPTIMAAATE